MDACSIAIRNKIWRHCTWGASDYFNSNIHNTITLFRLTSDSKVQSAGVWDWCQNCHKSRPLPSPINRDYSNTLKYKFLKSSGPPKWKFLDGGGSVWTVINWEHRPHWPCCHSTGRIFCAQHNKHPVSNMYQIKYKVNATNTPNFCLSKHINACLWFHLVMDQVHGTWFYFWIR